jgi:hypothetical protein
MEQKTVDKQQNLENQAQEILKIAQNYGVESNFFFLTTFINNI